MSRLHEISSLDFPLIETDEKWYMTAAKNSVVRIFLNDDIILMNLSRSLFLWNVSYLFMEIKQGNTRQDFSTSSISWEDKSWSLFSRNPFDFCRFSSKSFKSFSAFCRSSLIQKLRKEIAFILFSPVIFPLLLANFFSALPPCRSSFERKLRRKHRYHCSRQRLL